MTTKELVQVVNNKKKAIIRGSIIVTGVIVGVAIAYGATKVLTEDKDVNPFDLDETNEFDPEVSEETPEETEG